MALLLAVLLQATESKVVATAPEGFLIGSVVFSPDGSRFAYGVHAEKGDRSWVEFGAWKGPEGPYAVPIAMNADGRLLHMAANRIGTADFWLGDQKLQSTDIRKGETYRTVGCVSPDASRVLFCVGHDKEAWWGMSVNGTNGPRHSAKGFFPRFSVDGAVWAASVAWPDDLYGVVVNDVPGPKYEYVAGPSVSEKGVVAYAGEKADGTGILHHGDKTSPLKGEFPADVVLSGDGALVGFVFKKAGGHWLQVGERKSPALPRIHRAILDAKGTHWAGHATKDDKFCVFLDDQVLELKGDLRAGPWFSPDGKALMYATAKGRELTLSSVPVR
jgi:hypothetical protein